MRRKTLIDRQKELQELNGLLESRGAAFAGMTGRRRLGKTTLLEHWAAASGAPTLFWGATKKSGPLLLQSFSQALLAFEHGSLPASSNFSYTSWEAAFGELARISNREGKSIAILDEFPYAVSVEPALPSVLQHAWDHQLKWSNLALVLCGSQIGMMNDLFRSDAPLFQRIQGPLRIQPLPFRFVGGFLPGYSFDQRLSIYAVFGGVPAYLEQLDPTRSYSENIRQQVFSSFGIFAADPERLIGEGVSELSTYLSILDAVANGAHTPSEIVAKAGINPTTNPAPYLNRLSEMEFLRNDYPLTVPPEKRPRSKQPRYVVNDPMLQFYFRFVERNRSQLGQGFYNTFEARLQEGLAAYIGQTAFEEVCRQWLREQGAAGEAPFLLEDVGQIWGSKKGQAVQVDVAGISWRERRLLIGEAKWTETLVGVEVVHKLLGQTIPRALDLLPETGEGEKAWQVHPVIFAREGFSNEAYREASQNGVELVSVDKIEDELREL